MKFPRVVKARRDDERARAIDETNPALQRRGSKALGKLPSDVERGLNHHAAGAVDVPILPVDDNSEEIAVPAGTARARLLGSRLSRVTGDREERREETDSCHGQVRSCQCVIA